MAHWDKEDVFLAQLDDPSNTCCVLPKKCLGALNIFIFDDTNSWHSSPVITWAGHTRHMTGPHTKYFPTYFYNPDIFCLPLISFLLTGCSQVQWDAWRVSLVAWHSDTLTWHQKTAKKINECVCVHMTRVASWHHHISLPDMRPPGTGGGDQASCVSRCLLTLWFIIKSDVHKTRALIHTGAPGAN